MSKYLIYAKSVTGARAYVHTDDEEELAEFSSALLADPQTHAYAVIPLESLTFIQVNPELTEDDFVQEAREKMAELLASGNPLGEGLPTVEIDGFKFVNASGEELPQELIEGLIEAMEREGKLVRDDGGQLVASEDLKEGELGAVDVRLDADGDLASSAFIELGKKQLN